MSNNGDLSTKAMLIDLSISQCTFRKLDKRVTQDVATQHGASEDAGRYNKMLIAKDAIADIKKTANEARTFHYDNTLPWLDAGARILPAANYMDYTRKMQDLKSRFENAVADFMANYDGFVQDARARLNGLFKASDYPSYDQLARKYGFSFNVTNIPSGGDFRVDIQGDEVAKIQADIEARLQATTQKAMKDLWSRLHKAVGSMAERLSEEDKVFRDTLVNNLCDLVELLPKLNITDDPKLEDMRREIEEKLCQTEPNLLRADPIKRKATAEDAASILEAMAGYCG